ncbi:hypothetical protein [Bradyrhizobium sp. Tv2a-2]|uniref:hypothetical protein n=1 Tax=Bradyrhizobium sp. Tv2a-2 TaxID=113395 RepID=UPI000424F8AD|nr:hypothetical protein [Bradyrhizobium sp. Tv2a-2]
MTDTWNVTAAYDKSSYNAGDVMTVTISGNDVLTTTTTTQQQSGALTLTLTASDGSTTTITIPATTVTSTHTTSTPESVTVTGFSDDSGRVWTIAPSGLSISATA